MKLSLALLLLLPVAVPAQICNNSTHKTETKHKPRDPKPPSPPKEPKPPKEPRDPKPPKVPREPKPIPKPRQPHPEPHPTPAPPPIVPPKPPQPTMPQPISSTTAKRGSPEPVQTPSHPTPRSPFPPSGEEILTEGSGSSWDTNLKHARNNALSSAKDQARNSCFSLNGKVTGVSALILQPLYIDTGTSNSPQPRCDANYAPPYRCEASASAHCRLPKP